MYKIDIKHLNPFYRHFLETFENTTDSPVEYMFTAMLPSLGALISTNRWLQWGSKKVYPNIWCMLVGSSTNMRKSTSLNIGLYFNNLFNQEETDRYFILPNDGSLAALLPILNKEKQGVIKHSEVATLLENMSKGYNNNMKSLFTDFFDVPHTHKISLKSEDISVVEPIFSMSTATTLNWLKVNINKNDCESGFLARFLYCYKESKDCSIAIPDSPDSKNLEYLKAAMRKVINLPPIEIKYDDSFKKVYSAFYYQIDKLLNNPLVDEGAKSLYGRLQTDYFLKLTILECVLTGKTIATEVEADNVKYLISYYLNQAKTIISKIHKTDNAKREEKVLQFIELKGVASLTQIHHLFNNNLQSAKIKQIIQCLIDTDRIQEQKNNQTTVYTIKKISEKE